MITKNTEVAKLARRAARAQMSHYYDLMHGKSTLKIVKGDLLKLAEEGNFHIIVQGCNCFNTMGSGIAAQIRQKYPDAFLVDQETQPGDYNKLGNYTVALGKRFNIVNAYTQYGFNKGGSTDDVFEYTSFELILQKLAHQWPTCNFGFPKIGMGLAGGDEDTIMNMLDDFSRVIGKTGGTVTVVEYGQ